ncbi:MAG: hypothetical protein A2669_03000 [Candidatus Yanofskybacteria bacterium RIFCSPHIGHO2_01_FULL_48_25b]|uniref:Uncharacterized protein n=1 Tax=Candidatus Yanofskybacteria bacterium RIFCSPHIGHO2_01_FULL_48_25b TaxID=1802672 RepID=A0A1F8F2W2_9BACT|nr:MAG: hypothetical protein A2669_03000 [Candidatus Yanofskybacteria bacterium RIFCSPHIGHO2_01_FULL_48_25b]
MFMACLSREVYTFELLVSASFDEGQKKKLPFFSNSGKYRSEKRTRVLKFRRPAVPSFFLDSFR